MAIKTEDLRYRDGSTACIGFIAYDEARADRKPGVLVVHDARGIGPSTLERTRMIAELGYVGLAADIFGERWQPKSPEETGSRMQAFRDDPLTLRTRAKAALSALSAHPQVDASRLFAIGFCFGGTVVLELARAGLPLLGVVSFHGGLETKTPARKGEIKASVLVCHGADDPWVPLAHRQVLEEEMRAAGADWQLIVYGDTEHNFTSGDPPPEAGNIPGLRYNALTDKRSWRAMRDFFDERLAAPEWPET